MDLACVHQDLITVTIYDALQSDALEFIVFKFKRKL